MNRPATDWLEAVKGAERRGELLTAVDLAEQGLAERPDDLWLKHRAVLALARAGATGEAAQRFLQYGLSASEEEDIAALRARIAKDLALEAPPWERRAGAVRARDLYEAIHGRTGGYYPAINAATLSLVAGDPARAHELARTALAVLDRSGEDSYYAAATEAEARLLLGDEPAARDALERAAATHGGDYGSLATTRRQLRLVCALTGMDAEIIGILAGPGVAHFCGHRIAAVGASGRFPAEAEQGVSDAIQAELARDTPRYAYGSLASGADILCAEALLARGTELHVVLPFARDAFIESSVAPSGSAWVERFHRCLSAAFTVTYATDDAFVPDDALYRYAGELAMGLALLRARYLDADVRQLAVWDGNPDPGDGEAGTAQDIATWRAAGQAVSVIPVEDPPAPRPGPNGGVTDPSGRVMRAMLFADVKGFSRLADEQVPAVVQRVLGAFAAVLARYDEVIEHRNTWGDALYVVLTDTVHAANCALELQDAMSATDMRTLGLEDQLVLRMGLHIGPVFPIEDPVLGVRVFAGSHVSRTARIEPVTPPGTVYVTEQFAAALELAQRRELGCDYVGHMPTAKDYGRLRMYRLRRRLPRGLER
ncbi:MAG TPA: adenylate/guanylate cyclase domain-containing protein [Gaiellales bacterium]|nr:adenylate/guanylate cyclase domain-containing protein [Gaiellales bacterium]